MKTTKRNQKVFVYLPDAKKYAKQMANRWNKTYLVYNRFSRGVFVARFGDIMTTQALNARYVFPDLKEEKCKSQLNKK